MAKRENGAGSIRKKEINGRVTWEGRVTIGRDSGTGKLKSRSFYGKTQKEVSQKMKAALAELERGEYKEPSKRTVSQWLDEWCAEYLISVKPNTVSTYKANIEHHIKPAIGAIRLDKLTPSDVQKMYNRLKNNSTGEELSPKTKKNIHGTLHKALAQACRLGYIKNNPADNAELPKVIQAEIEPLDSTDIINFLAAIQGHEYESVYFVTLFTGMRQGEILGLTWDEIDFDKGQITIKHQLQRMREYGGEYVLSTPKNGKFRTITPAKEVMQVLEREREKQRVRRLSCLSSGEVWDNPFDLVFTHKDGSKYCPQTVYYNFKKLAESIGRDSARFHDLRHSFAVASLSNGDDIKTVQQNLGHHTAAFTLQTYAHVTEEMKQNSADRMSKFIQYAEHSKMA